ncbi:hypothetical protein RSW84_24925, partial [Escherichia coli]|uniref:hypothetical protein n=1 Tax=Escherichia coli TaxID=562 RepID=UPI0028E09B93
CLAHASAEPMNCILRQDKDQALLEDPTQAPQQAWAVVGRLSGLAPALQIKTDDNAANPRIFIRGVGVNDFNPSTASAGGIYVDGVYVASPLAQM